MISKIKDWWKINMIPVIFFVFIIFGLIAVIFSGADKQEKATELVYFADSRLLYVNDTVQAISSKSLLSPNDDQSYESLANDIQAFSNYLSQSRGIMPRNNIDKSSKDLQEALDLFLSSTQVDIDLIYNRVVSQRALREDTFTYGKMQSYSQNGGTRAELLASYESGTKIFDLLQQQVDVELNENIKERDQKNIDAERILLSNVKTIIDSGNSEQLNQDEINQLKNVYVQGWPPSNPAFPQIRKDDITDKDYAQQFSNIQQLMLRIIEIHKIKVEATTPT